MFLVSWDITQLAKVVQPLDPPYGGQGNILREIDTGKDLIEIHCVAFPSLDEAQKFVDLAPADAGVSNMKIQEIK